jgi:hypothetical protein
MRTRGLRYARKPRAVATLSVTKLGVETGTTLRGRSNVSANAYVHGTVSRRSWSTRFAATIRIRTSVTNSACQVAQYRFGEIVETRHWQLRSYHGYFGLRRRQRFEHRPAAIFIGPDGALRF